MVAVPVVSEMTPTQHFRGLLQLSVEESQHTPMAVWTLNPVSPSVVFIAVGTVHVSLGHHFCASFFAHAYIVAVVVPAALQMTSF